MVDSSGAFISKSSIDGTCKPSLFYPASECSQGYVLRSSRCEPDKNNYISC